MADLTSDSDRLIGEGRALLRDNREGGRHRRTPSIGEGSRRLKKSNLKARIRNAIMTVLAIWLAGGIIGGIVGGIGILGFTALIVACVVAAMVLSQFPRLKTPTRADIARGEIGRAHV